MGANALLVSLRLLQGLTLGSWFGEEAFTNFGWRIPISLSFVLLGALTHIPCSWR